MKCEYAYCDDEAEFQVTTITPKGKTKVTILCFVHWNAAFENDKERPGVICTEDLAPERQ